MSFLTVFRHTMLLKVCVSVFWSLLCIIFWGVFCPCTAPDLTMWLPPVTCLCGAVTVLTEILNARIYIPHMLYIHTLSIDPHMQHKHYNLNTCWVCQFKRLYSFLSGTCYLTYHKPLYVSYILKYLDCQCDLCTCALTNRVSIVTISWYSTVKKFENWFQIFCIYIFCYFSTTLIS